MDINPTEQTEQVLSRDIIELLIEHFSSKNQKLKKACNDKFSPQSHPTPCSAHFPEKISESKARILAKDPNPYIRIELAKKGLCPDILKHDSVPQVRLYILKNTGHYSEHYQARERDPSMVREMLIQGIETSYYESLNDPVVNDIIDEVKAYLKIIEDVESFNVETTESLLFLLEGLTPFSEENSHDILSAIDYLRINLRNNEPDFTEKREIDLIIEENIKDILLQSEVILAPGTETRVGVVESLSCDKKRVFIKGCNGHTTSYDTLELMKHMLEDYQAKKIDEENHKQKGFLNKKK